MARDASLLLSVITALGCASGVDHQPPPAGTTLVSTEPSDTARATGMPTDGSSSSEPGSQHDSGQDPATHDCEFEGRVLGVQTGSFGWVDYCEEVTPLEVACERLMSGLAGRPLDGCPDFEDALHITGWMEGRLHPALTSLVAGQRRTHDGFRTFDELLAMWSWPATVSGSLSGDDPVWVLLYDQDDGTLVSYHRMQHFPEYFCCGPELVEAVVYGGEFVDRDLSHFTPYEPADFE